MPENGLLLVVGVFEPVTVPGTPTTVPDGLVQTGIWQHGSLGSVVSVQLDGSGGYDGHLTIKQQSRINEISLQLLSVHSKYCTQ